MSEWSPIARVAGSVLSAKPRRPMTEISTIREKRRSPARGALAQMLHQSET